MKSGIIGLPNVGKSTLFNCLTKLKAPAENYPFCTVDPHVGRVEVPDSRLNKLAEAFQSEKTIPAFVDFVDIAGLIPGAHKGAGLGNRFLSHIREADALVHVIRVFEEENIVHTQGIPDPLRDIQLIETELILADVETLEKAKEKRIKLAKASKEKKQELFLIEQLIDFLLKEEKLAKEYKVKKEEREFFKNLGLLTAKPCLYVCNTDETGQGKEIIKKIEEKYGAKSVLTICALLEEQIAQLESAEEKKEFLMSLNQKESGLDRLTKSSYELLNLITFFTAGKKEARAWTVTKGSVAPTAGGKIHSDFEKGFICAEVYSFEDFKVAGSEKVLKESGGYRREGKDYIVKDGDVILFRFNV